MALVATALFFSIFFEDPHLSLYYAKVRRPMQYAEILRL